MTRNARTPTTADRLTHLDRLAHQMERAADKLQSKQAASNAEVIRWAIQQLGVDQ